MNDAEAPWPARVQPFFAAPAAPSAALAHLPQAHRGSVHWSAAHAHELLTFYVGEALHGLHIREVAEVGKLPPLTCIPRVQPGVLGVMSLRGTLIPVVDAAGFLLPQKTLGSDGLATGPSHLVVLHDPVAPLGLAVGPIVGVSRLPADALVPYAATGHAQGAGEEPCIAGFATTLQRVTVVVLQGGGLSRRFAAL